MIVDDHLMARLCTRHLLEAIARLQVIGEAADGFEAVALVNTLRPDLVIMDIVMPGMDGIEATRRITATFPAVRVIVLSSHKGEEYRRAARESGAAAYIVKGDAESFAAEVCRILSEIDPQDRPLCPGRMLAERY